MKNKENPAEFINKFHNIIRDHENYEGAIPLTPEEKRFIFLMLLRKNFLILLQQILFIDRPIKKKEVTS